MKKTREKAFKGVIASLTKDRARIQAELDLCTRQRDADVLRQERDRTRAVECGTLKTRLARMGTILEAVAAEIREMSK